MNLNAKPSDLLAILKINRGNHAATFEKARAVYTEAKAYLDSVETQIESLIEGAKSKYPKGAVGSTFFWNLPVPQNHTSDYDRVIKIMEIEQRPAIELSEQEVSQYVLDNWSWTKDFTTTAMNYGVTWETDK